MTTDGTISLIIWGDDEHRFKLALGQLRELQDKREAGAIEILDRFRERKWRVDDVREVIRLGLIGGGMAPVDAFTLINRYVDNRPIMESLPVAFTILATALLGPMDDQLGKAQTEESSKVEGSASPNFMVQEPRSDSRRSKRMQ